MFKNIKKKIAENYIKSHYAEKGISNLGSFLFSSQNIFSFANSAITYLNYYSFVAPVGDAVNKISESCSDIQFNAYLKDENGLYFIDEDNEYIKKLNKPNNSQTNYDFFKDGYIDYLVTGNNYIIVSCNFNNEILEIYNLSPEFITIDVNAFGHANKYRYSCNGREISFEYGDFVINGVRHYNILKQSNANVYLFHFKEPCKNARFSKVYGDSPLQSIQLECDQYLEASQYNTNLIRCGFNPKVLLSPKEEMRNSSAQFDKFIEQIQKFYSGSNNSGNTALLSMLPMSAQFLASNAKDMDFKELMQRMRVAIYNKFNVQLPMVEGEYTSNSNMKQSILQFYDSAILPLANKYAKRHYEMIYKIFYPKSPVVKIDYEKTSIAALQERMILNSTEMSKSRAITKNEIRKYLGLEKVKGGADALYVDGNAIAVAGDLDFIDDIKSTMREVREEKRSEKKASLKEILVKEIDFNGNRIYTDNDIDKILDDEV
jgi:HK97 family phage portal protein